MIMNDENLIKISEKIRLIQKLHNEEKKLLDKSISQLN